MSVIANERSEVWQSQYSNLWIEERDFMNEKIPPAMIGTLSDILSSYYTHDNLDNLFLSSGSPDNIPEGSKLKKVSAWLRTINNECKNPLEILGNIIAEFMDTEINGLYINSENLPNHRKKVIDCLAKDGFSYSRGGMITKGTSIPSVSLRENIKNRGLNSIEQEINRALSNVEKDPLSAVHNAGSVLEATLKNYLDHYQQKYEEDKDTLSSLWQKTVQHIGIHPKELSDKDLKEIASGLFAIVNGTMHLRNKKSAAHGKSENQFQNISIKPRHARLAINASHTIASYIVELMEDKDF